MVWLACVLTLLLPGLGHVYAGRFLRAFGVLLFAAALLLVWLALWSLGSGRAWLVWTTMGLGVVTVVVLMTDAARAARRADTLPERVALRCASFFLMGSLAFAGVRAATSTHWMFPSRVASDSMQPGLLAGDFFWTNCRTFRERDPERGDLVTIQVAQSPPGTITPIDRAGELTMPVRMAKRIIGVPGDRVAMRSGTLSVNDTEVPRQPAPDEPGVVTEHLGTHFQVLTSGDRAADFEAVVEPERYFVLGDNRGNSADSRTWGTIPRADVVGRVTYVYFSWDATAKRPRWARIGRPLR
jgi:signal peptidase I